jgi:hypothetical protein
MKLNMAVAIGAILASNACAHTVDGVELPRVLVCMERTSDPSLVIDRAQNLTTWMFDQIGVALVWRDLQHCPGEARPIVIRLSVNTPRGVLPGALAVSYPFEGVHIRVFYDRLLTVTERCPLSVLLAHVLAHEISHILQGTDEHSASGLMKRRWDASDFWRMAREVLNRALSLAPDLAEAHGLMACLMARHEWDWEQAEHHCQQARASLSRAPQDIRRSAFATCRPIR